MQRIVCEMCNSTDIKKVDGFFVCDSCGTKYSPEEAKKLMIEVTVKEDNSEKLENLYRLARRARSSGDQANAAAYYSQILNHCPDDWEAAFYATLCNSYGCVIANIAQACDLVRTNMGPVFQLISKLPKGEQKAAVAEVVNASTSFGVTMFEAALKHHMSIDVQIMSKYNHELKQRLVSASYVLVSCAAEVRVGYGNDKDIGSLLLLPAKRAMELQSRQTYVSIVFDVEVSKNLLSWIETYDPDYVENYKKKQNQSMTTGNIVLMVLGLGFLAMGIFMEGDFATWFGYGMGGFCLLWGIFRIIVQLANKKLNG